MIMEEVRAESLNIKDIEIISSVAEIKEGKLLLLSESKGLSNRAVGEINSSASCMDICHEWARREGVIFVPALKQSLFEFDSDIMNRRYLNSDFLEKYSCIPVKDSNNDSILVTNSPFSEDVDDALFLLGLDRLSCKIGFANASVVLSEIDKIKIEERKEKIDKFNLSKKDELPVNDYVDLDDLDKSSESATTYFVNNALKDAISSKASDIHFETKEDEISTRIRVNGIMMPQFSASKKMSASSIARIKVISKLNPSETRMPQDGRIKVKVLNKLVDLRVSCVPTLHGERVVVRFLGGTQSAGITSSSFQDNVKNVIKWISSLPEGLILIVGPTGSGKTTTIYSILESVNREDKNVITIEDPIEKEVDGVSQIPINTAIGFDFSDALQNVLRQDPDVILIGEIRSNITAKAAIQASITGHLVLSTVHAPDSISSIPRMLDMDISPLLLANSLKCVIAQRLVRKVCTSCSIVNKDMSRSVCKKGCEFCKFTGFEGRVPVVEFIKLDEDARASIIKGDPLHKIWSKAIERGSAKSLMHQAQHLIDSGITVKEELERVFGDLWNE